jgi:hypothetical protein
MFRRILLFLFLLFGLATVGRGENLVSVKIRQFGLAGVYSGDGATTLIEVESRNNTNGALSFNLFISELNLEIGALPASETFKIPLTLLPGEMRTLNVPLHVFSLNHAVIFVEARDPQHNILGRTGRRVGEKSQGTVIAVLCASAAICRSLQQSILLSGTAEEQTRKSQSLRIIQLSEAPSVGWAYAPASTVILAAPFAQLSEAQRLALELYVHNGGTLALVEDQLADGPPLGAVSTAGAPVPAGASRSVHERFLGAYRAQAQNGKAFPVGEGSLIQIRSVSGQEFTDYFRPLGFSESTPQEIRERWESRVRGRGQLSGAPEDEALWLMKRLGTTFRFPTFLQLLFWIVGYLALVGVVNFIILRRIGRPEWGWITIPAISIFFSALLYVFSAWNHPRNFGIDEIVEYRLDPVSPLALLRAKVRVSAPVRASVHPVLPAALNYEYALPGFVSDQIIVPQRSSNSIDEITFGEKWETRFELRRWSFQDLDFQGHRKLAGTIYRDTIGRVHNDSGVNYQQAILVDHEDVFVLDSFFSGSVADLGHVPRLHYAQETGRVVTNTQAYPGPPFAFHVTEGGWHTSEEQLRQYEEERNSLSRKPFSLLELIRGWSPNGDDVFYQTRAVFFGLSSEATLGAELRDRAPDHKAFSLTIVKFKDWP